MKTNNFNEFKACNHGVTLLSIVKRLYTLYILNDKNERNLLYLQKVIS